MPPMGSRKRVQPEPSAAASQSSLPASEHSPPEPARGRSTSQRQRSAASWYTKSWPRVSKAAAVTEVARESISVAGNVASDLVASTATLPNPSRQFRSPSIQLTKKDGPSSRSLPATVATTRVNIASNGLESTLDGPDSQTSDPAADAKDKEDKPADSASPQNNTGKDTQGSPNRNETQGTITENRTPADTETGEPQQPEQTQPSGWFSWWYRSTPTENTSVDHPKTADAPVVPPSEEQPPLETDDKQEDEREEQAKKGSATSQQAHSDAETQSAEQSTSAQRRSWFLMWSGSPAPPKPPAEPQEPRLASEQATAEEVNNKPPTDPAENNRSESVGSSARQQDNARSSGWSFWYRDTSKDRDTKKAEETQNGSVAEAEPAATTQSKENQEPGQKGQNPPAKEVVKGQPKERGEPAPTAAVISVPEQPATPTKAKAPEGPASKQLQKAIPNQVLPSFRDTFATQESPSLLQTIGRQTLGRFFHYSKESDKHHVYVMKDPPRIRKALAIGVHGYFPAPLIRTVLGQPTGTSVKFSNMAAKAIRQWTENHGYSCDVQKIALEGEGRIAERVDLLWKLLLNWIEDIRKADFVLVACHSQGVPVATILVSKLISFGCLNAQRVGICAMAGVNLGPFPDFKSRWISGSAGELFDFAHASSQVSRDYEAALESALNFGVRISYIGSIDDQLVSLESSLFSPASHPYIYRAAFVDGRVHAPSFLSHLVGFALKLRNLGIPDHGIIRELSSPLAGSLYAGEGHSRLYEDEAVYYLAIEFALETSDVNGAALRVQRPPQSPTPNPYILPFAMRGLLEEEYVRRELYQETMELLKQFDDWKPSSKVLKDVKFRLEGIRSKL
ncbi:hypothetical protein AOR_1_574094 [Paecilomyces variotii No. 5]|uniref:YMC020W-like alpha/beta hydrolase domain-containing protein n=1 Tax=Byssochlamys spectabilis (strain No. 5 / NBRC 109023) TaxID=1356009 RepID=V5G3G7_BYSSN|nr:hypothetical protein AOR_1_574094 [Paecilomyces variotii No. 5]